MQRVHSLKCVSSLDVQQHVAEVERPDVCAELRDVVDAEQAAGWPGRVFEIKRRGVVGIGVDR